MGQIRVGTAGWTDNSLIDSGWYPAAVGNPEKRELRKLGRVARLRAG